MTVNDKKNTKNKIAFKIEIPKKFLKDPDAMLSSQDMEKNFDEITVVAIDLKTGSILGKYSAIEYKLKFL
jgi:hypothetical protein